VARRPGLLGRQRRAAQERIDPTTDFGKAMLNIMFVMAELQLDQLKSGWKTAKGRAIGHLLS
jgi:DNA invertase Pin-like site-specific DNA recombinase